MHLPCVSFYLFLTGREPYLHAPALRGLGYSLLVLEHRAINKDYGERKRFLDAMAT